MSQLQTKYVVLFLLTMFSAMLVLRLDDKQHWTWFGVFTPMFILDLKLACMSGYEVYKHMTRLVDRTCPREALFLLGVVFKVFFEILICLKLESDLQLPWTVIFIPLWASLIFFQANILTPLNYFCFGH